MCVEREGIDSATKEKALCVMAKRKVKPTDRRLTFVLGKGLLLLWEIPADVSFSLLLHCP